MTKEDWNLAFEYAYNRWAFGGGKSKYDWTIACKFALELVKLS